MHYLAISSSVKNEGEYLLEWLCFHRLVGVEHFLLFDNASTDDTVEIAERFERAYPGSVTLIPNHSQPAQRIAQKRTIRDFKNFAKWIAFIDGDEFLFGTEEGSLPRILRGYEGYSALGAHWLNFGSSGHQTTPTGLCIEAFTKRARDGFPSHGHVKSIVQMSEVIDPIGYHLFNTVGDTVTESGQVIPYETSGRLDSSSHAKIRINHYITKSEEQLAAKVARGRPLPKDSPNKFRDIDHYRGQGRNDVEDLTIQRFVPGVRDMMDRVSNGRRGHIGRLLERIRAN